VKGSFEWKNPFGYLSGSTFPYLPLYFILLIAFLVLSTVWGYNLYKFRSNLMGLQHMTTATIVVSMLEAMLWAIDYSQYNQSGTISDAINIIGALFTAGKLTLIRTLILLVALGYSITTPILERRIKTYVFILTALYGVCAAINEYLWVMSSMGVDVTMLVQTIALGVVSGLNVVYLLWITKELIAHFKNLEQLNQTAKLTMYKKFATFLGGFIIISILFFLVQFGLFAADLADELWRIWWIWDGYWEIGYFLVSLLIAILWWPNENNERYAYSVQLGADGNPTDDLTEFGLASDSSEEDGQKKLAKPIGIPDDDVDKSDEDESDDL